MKTALLRFCASALLIFFLGARIAVAQEPLTFRRAIDLAVAHSTELAASNAEQMRAYMNYLETRDVKIPQLSVGSSVGYAYGFPLSLEGSAPTVLNFSALSSFFSFAQREFVRAAKAQWGVAQAQSRDQRAQLILETALVYIELNAWQQRLPVLRSEAKVAQDVEYASAQRVQAGIENPVEKTKAQITAAQTRVHIAHAQGAMDLLRLRLSQLTGLPADSLTTVPDSIPAVPASNSESGSPERAVQASSAVEIADQAARAKRLNAKGEHKALYPRVDFAAQYGLIQTSLTDFQKFFQPGTFQTHNVTFGMILRLPLLNLSQRAHAQAADADALRARKEAEQARNKAALTVMQLEHSVEELSAVRDMTELQYQLAQAQLEMTRGRITVSATQRELQNALIDAAERTLDRINSDFELQRAKLELLRATGELDKWALSPANLRHD